MFCRSLRSQIKQKKNGVESLTAIYESKNVELILSLPHMPQLRDHVLGPDEAHVFGTILAKRVAIQEEEIDLRRCGLTDDLVDVMVQNLKDYKFEVSTSSVDVEGFLMSQLRICVRPTIPAGKTSTIVPHSYLHHIARKGILDIRVVESSLSISECF